MLNIPVYLPQSLIHEYFVNVTFNKMSHAPVGYNPIVRTRLYHLDEETSSVRM